MPIVQLPMQRNGKHILWEHLRYLYDNMQAESGLYVGHRLTYEHISLTSYSKMKVNLAAQVNVTVNEFNKDYYINFFVGLECFS